MFWFGFYFRLGPAYIFYFNWPEIRSAADLYFISIIFVFVVGFSVVVVVVVFFL